MTPDRVSVSRADFLKVLGSHALDDAEFTPDEVAAFMRLQAALTERAPQPDAQVSDADVKLVCNAIIAPGLFSPHVVSAAERIRTAWNTRAPQPNPDHFRAIAIAAYDKLHGVSGKDAFTDYYDALRTREEAGG